MNQQVQTVGRDNAWTAWNLENVERGESAYGKRVASLVEDCTHRCPGSYLLAEVACGSGWLLKAVGHLFDNLWGTDVSSASVTVAAKQVPNAMLVTGDFTGTPSTGQAAMNLMYLPQAADLVVSVESIAHMEDQREFFKRCRYMNRAGGRLLLFTQNPTTWSRSSYLMPKPEGAHRHWPTREEIKEHLLCSGYRLISIRTIEPHGDRGLLLWRPYANGIMRRLLRPFLGKEVANEVTKKFFEDLGLGRTLVVEAEAL